MTIHTAMAAQYTEITKEDIEKFFRARYRVYHPSEYPKARGEFVYDLHVGDDVAIRIYSSIQRRGSSAGVGEDAIRVVLVSTKLDRPINKKAGSSIVKRTQGWRNSLTDRIDSFLEEYHEKYDFYNAIASGEQPPKKEIQIEKPISMMPPVKEKEVGSDYDSAGNFVPNSELKEKYLIAIDRLVARIGNGSYGDFIKSIGKWLADKGKLTPKQKAAIDTPLKRNNLMSLVSSKESDVKVSSSEEEENDVFLDFNLDTEDAEENNDILLVGFAPETGI